MAVLNADFSENTGSRPDSPDGWTAVPASSGADYFFGPGFSFGAVSNMDDTVSQIICVSPGCRYAVSYYITDGSSGAIFPAVDGAVLRDSNGVSLEIDSTNPSANQGTTPQTQYVGYFTATSSSAVLSFGGRNTCCFTDLTGIHIGVA